MKRGYVESQDKLFLEVDELKRDFTDWGQDSKEHSERLYKIQKYLGERKVREQQRHFFKHFEEWEANKTVLEKAYVEDARFEGPATYWSNAASNFKKQGYFWSFILVVVLCFGLINFQEFFLVWLKGEKSSLELASIQGILLFGTILALYAFGIKSLSRLYSVHFI